MSKTHHEFVGEGYWITMQYCEFEGCDEFLGVNYYGTLCSIHRPTR